VRWQAVNDVRVQVLSADPSAINTNLHADHPRWSLGLRSRQPGGRRRGGRRREGLCAEVVSAFVGELSRSLKKRAKRELGLASVAEAHIGAVCAVQRTDPALRLNVHLHVLALDGVCVRDTESGALVFEQLGTPSHAEVLDVARRTAERVDRLLTKSGRSLEREGDEPRPELVLDEPGLASCYAAAAQGISVSGERAGLPELSRSVTQPRAQPPEESG
jgi:hypothetical protein